MAAGTWKVFNKAKHYIGDTTINLSGGTFHITLHTSTTNLKTSASALPLTAYSQLTQEVAENYGYSSSGKALGVVRWTVGTGAQQQKFDISADPYWSANGGTITGIKYAAIRSGTNILCYCTLTTGAGGISLTSGSRLTIQFASGGCLTLA